MLFRLALKEGRWRTGLLYTLQIFLVQMVGLLIAALCAQAALKTSAVLLKDILPLGFVLRMGWYNIGTLLVVAAVSTLAFSGPLFVNLFSLRLNALLSESPLGAGHVSTRRAR